MFFMETTVVSSSYLNLWISSTWKLLSAITALHRSSLVRKVSLSVMPSVLLSSSEMEEPRLQASSEIHMFQECL